MSRLHVATRKGLFTLDRSQGSWKISSVDFPAIPITQVLRDPRDATMYVAVQHEHFGSKMHRSDDDGRTWTAIATPEYPAKPERYVERRPMEGEPYEWKLRLLWCLEAGGTADLGQIWCGTLPGGLFVSHDRGDSWDLVRSLWDMPERGEWFGGGADYPGIHSICVDPRDSRHVTVGVSCGGAWATYDGGESWVCRGHGMRAEFMPPDLALYPNIQDPHRMVHCEANPDVMWVQHHNGIFKSINAGEKWEEITDVLPSTFGFPVAVHPRDPDTAWFVPAQKDEYRIPVDGRLVVNRTSDGGKTFETLTRGLPQEHAYDLVYRHALDVTADGSTLAFGSTTGNLWLSEDSGDSWQTLSNNLPPVYQVRFAV
jgi:hypothetical protein